MDSTDVTLCTDLIQIFLLLQEKVIQTTRYTQEIALAVITGFLLFIVFFYMMSTLFQVLNPLDGTTECSI